ncbi:MAG: hypothetical protein RLZ46_538 [Actinomycetota bacterium]|jgi:hypothetical protein
MKRLLLLVFAASLVLPTASAAPKAVAVKKLDIVASAVSAEGLVATGKTLVTYSNTGSTNSNIELTGLDVTGVQQWLRTIDSGVDEIATAATVDAAGNIWLAGSSAAVTVPESVTAAIAAENPDGVVAEELPKVRSDMNQITIWKLSPIGELLATFLSVQTSPALVSALSVNSSGISLVGVLADRPFLLSATPTGVFAKPLFIGTNKSALNAVVRSPDGSINLFGESSETLGGKKVAGARDGILVKVSKAGAITSVVRSSAIKAQRSWLAADSTLTLTGYVKSGKVIESAFTKFNSSFVPTWTMRIPSTGSSTVLTAAGTTYGALSSNSAIKGVTGWKPTTPTLLLATFTNKGVMTGAYADSQLSAPISLVYTKELGLCGLARGSADSISIFRLATR